MHSTLYASYLMIVPDYWAEARQQHRAAGKQITIRRWGWSSSSEDDARAMAEARAAEALQRLLGGEKLTRREPKAAYNGAFGVPIREEVLSRHGEEVVTRNSYGAHCLNTPRALFADVDFASTPRAGLRFAVFGLLALLAVVIGGFHLQSWGVAGGMLLLALLLTGPLAGGMDRLNLLRKGGHERIARQRLMDFLAGHPAWNVRLYRTPGGFRLLATHQAFEASAPEVQQFFAAVGADPVYVRMCSNQQCFRARLTAKPWRIGIGDHMRPRPGIWPVHPDRLGIRQQWVAAYERAAASHSACHFVESLGSGKVDPEISTVVVLHDREARAHEFALAVA